MAEDAANRARSRAIAPEQETPDFSGMTTREIAAQEFTDQNPAEPVVRPVLAEVPTELPHEFAARLKARLGAAYASWFGNVRMIGFDDLRSTLVLSAPTGFIANWLSTRYEFYILDAWAASRHLHGGPKAERLEIKVIAAPKASQ